MTNLIGLTKDLTEAEMDHIPGDVIYRIGRLAGIRDLTRDLLEEGLSTKDALDTITTLYNSTVRTARDLFKP